jgi:predicted acyl esterase
MDDGVSLAATLYLPDGTPPAGGWPAVMLFHGLGGTRASMAPIAEGFLVNQGYAVLAYDARGHGASGGLVTLDGPREMADLREAFDWFTSRPDVSDTQVGAMGFSLGGGAVLRSTVEGVPWKAIVPVITWTKLYDALAPQGWPKTGAIASFLQSVQRWDPTVYALAQDAIRSENTEAVRAFTSQRSSLNCAERSCDGLTSVSTPTFFIQGRRDFAFDLNQVRSGFKAVKGPARLYIGDLGHAPATNPDAEKPHYLTEAREWFDRFLKGVPNGIDTRPNVELAPDPWTGKTYSYRGLPRTKPLHLSTFRFAGTRTIAASGKIVRTITLPKKPLETFWGGSVKVKVSSATGWPHLVAVLSALTPARDEIVISEGAAPTPGLTAQSKSVTIDLIATATFIPSGSRLQLTLASASTAQNIQNALYLDIGMPDSAKLTVGRATLRVPVMRKVVSRRKDTR